MEKILSICIASYNKSNHTTSLVKNILTCNNPELEVVVVDNASTDDTVSQLETIKDDRLRIIVNKENIGGARNFVASVFGGEGLFCFYTNDRDIVYPEKIDSFIEYLKLHKSIGGGHCVRELLSENKGDNPEYSGKIALLSLNYRGAHPTGFFFRRSLLDGISQESIDKYVVIEPYLYFPWEGFLCQIICKGYTVVQYNDVIWHSTGHTSHAKYESSYLKLGDLSNRFFYPKNRLGVTIEETKDTLSLAKENGIELSLDERYRMYAHLFRPQYAFAVYRYKVIYETPSLAYHYKVPCRKVSKEELNNCRKEMIEGYIAFIRSIEGGQSELEKYIYDVASARDKRYRKTRFRFFERIKQGIIKRIKNINIS